MPAVSFREGNLVCVNVTRSCTFQYEKWRWNELQPTCTPEIWRIDTKIWCFFWAYISGFLNVAATYFGSRSGIDMSNFRAAYIHNYSLSNVGFRILPDKHEKSTWKFFKPRTLYMFTLIHRLGNQWCWKFWTWNSKGLTALGESLTHTIHGTNGIFTYMNGWF